MRTARISVFSEPYLYIGEESSRLFRRSCQILTPLPDDSEFSSRTLFDVKK